MQVEGIYIETEKNVPDNFLEIFQRQCLQAWKEVYQALLNQYPESFPPYNSITLKLVFSRLEFIQLYNLNCSNQNRPIPESIPDWLYVFNFVGNNESKIVVDISSFPYSDKSRWPTGHEFNHVWLATVFALPLEFLYSFWPRGYLLQEGIAVAMHQLNDQFPFRNIKFPTLNEISERGIFYYCKERSEENFIYQYLAHFVIYLGRKIYQVVDKYPQNPFWVILALTQEAKREGTRETFIEKLKEIGLDFITIENDFRQEISDKIKNNLFI